ALDDLVEERADLAGEVGAREARRLGGELGQDELSYLALGVVPTGGGLRGAGAGGLQLAAPGRGGLGRRDVVDDLDGGDSLGELHDSETSTVGAAGRRRRKRWAMDGF